MTVKFCTTCGEKKTGDNGTQYCRRCKALRSLRGKSDYVRTPGYVYVVQTPSTGEVKIGFSIHPEKRAKEIRSQYVDCKDATLVAAIHKPNGAYEFVLHRMFDDLRVEGEWFIPSQRLYELIHTEDGWTIYNDLIVQVLF